MTEPKDTDLQRYLDGDSPLSRRYREASAESSPPALDDAILEAARAAVTARPRRRSSRWAAPLALAATTLLGVNLVWLLRDDAVPPAPRRAEMQKAESAPRPAPTTLDEEADAATAPATQQAAPPAAADRADRAEPSLAREQAPAAAAPPRRREAPESAAVTPEQERKMAAEASEQTAAALAEARRAAPEPERQAFRAKRAESSVAAPSALRDDVAPVRDDRGDIERAARGLADSLRAGDLAAVRTRFGASSVDDSRLRLLADILVNGELRPRHERDGVWLVDCVGADGAVLCRLGLQSIDGGWRLLDVAVPP